MLNFLGSNFLPSSILSIGNNNYVIYGNTGTTAKIVIVDISSGQFISKEFSGWTMGGMVFTNSGRLVGTGTLNNKAGWFEINASTAEMLLNSQTYLPAGFNTTEGKCITATADGGFLIGGTGCKTDGTSCALLLKTDSDGSN